MLRDYVVLFRACVDDKVLFVRGCLPALIVPACCACAGVALAFGGGSAARGAVCKICRGFCFQSYGMYDLVENEEEDLILSVTP